ncbi:hypothetical protein HYV83_05085 [Candidatus Woesearchaeota archaeon]|nr:hypothetical protein [Candidatus Woesearchaeota archaeon]
MPSRVNHKKSGIFAFEAVMWIVRSLILVFILLSIMFVTSAFFVRNIDTKLADSYTLMNVMYYSDSLALKDPGTGRVYPGVFDASKSGVLDDSFSYGEGDDAFIASKATAALMPSPKEYYYRKVTFNDWNILYIAGLTEGRGGIKKVSAAKKLLVYNSGKKTGADTKLEVVTKDV